MGGCVSSGVLLQCYRLLGLEDCWRLASSSRRAMAGQWGLRRGLRVLLTKLAAAAALSRAAAPRSPNHEQHTIFGARWRTKGFEAVEQSNLGLFTAA